MKLLASIRPEDVDTSVAPVDYSVFKTRPAGRAIVFDDKKVALIKVSKHEYYMLPGGGLESDDIQSGIAREILEELGAEAPLDKEIGIIEVFFDRWQQKQVDYCYTARLVHANSEKALTDFEVEEGHEIFWAANIDEAIKLVETADPAQTDGKLVRARDLRFLQECKNIMKHLYLFTLEMDPLEIGKVYDVLPSHVTLMSRFLSEMSYAELTLAVEYLFRRINPVVLTFGEVKELGPKRTIVHMVESPTEVMLHNELHRRLGVLEVAFQYPEFVGQGHKVHVSKRDGMDFKQGQTEVSSAAYLIEVVDGKRIPRAKIDIYIQN